MAAVVGGSSISGDPEADVTEVKDKKQHLKWLKGKQAGTNYAKEKHTIFHSLLHQVTNSDQIILERLDSCISSKDEDDIIVVDFAPLLEEGSVEEEDLVKDLLDLKAVDTTAKVLFHPVIQTFLHSRWQKIRLIFFLNFLAYCFFLLSYSVYLANIFYRPVKTQRRVKITQIESGTDQLIFPSGVSLVGGSDDEAYKNKTHKAHTLFHSCHHTHGAATCTFEIALMISITLLVWHEVTQLVTIGPKRYLREFENLLEVTIMALAIAGLALQTSPKILQWISAFGICLAYFEFIFLLGRYPALGGQTSLMFYSITRHLLRSLTNFLVLVVGFGFGFFIISHGKTGDNFENPFKAVAKTLTMTLGEFNFDDVYGAQDIDVYSRTFSICLLIMLALMGSLVLVNLIVALIVSDIEDLKREAQKQELVNKAQHILYVKSLLRFGFNRFQEISSPSHSVSVCSHSLCRCDALKLDADIVGELKMILRKKKVAEVLTGNSEKLRSMLMKVVLEGKAGALAEVLLGSD